MFCPLLILSGGGAGCSPCRCGTSAPPGHLPPELTEPQNLNRNHGADIRDGSFRGGVGVREGANVRTPVHADHDTLNGSARTYDEVVLCRTKH